MCRRVDHGQRIDAEAAPVDSLVALVSSNGDLVAVGRQQDTFIQPEKVFLSRLESSGTSQLFLIAPQKSASLQRDARSFILKLQ